MIKGRIKETSSPYLCNSVRDEERDLVVYEEKQDDETLEKSDDEEEDNSEEEENEVQEGDIVW